MYRVKCESINVPEKAIESNGEIAYAYRNNRFGIMKTSKKDDFSKISTKKQAKSIAQKVDKRKYKVNIVSA